MVQISDNSCSSRVVSQEMQFYGKGLHYRLNPYEFRKTSQNSYSEHLRATTAEHCVKSVQIRSLDIWSQSEYRKIRTRKNSVFGHFSRCGDAQDFLEYCSSGTSLIHCFCEVHLPYANQYTVVEKINGTKVKKSSKIGEDQETLISDCA